MLRIVFPQIACFFVSTCDVMHCHAPAALAGAVAARNPSPAGELAASAPPLPTRIGTYERHCCKPENSSKHSKLQHMSIVIYIHLHCKFWEAGEPKQQVSSNKCSTSHTNHFGHARSWPGELAFLLLILLHVSRPFVNMLVTICICKLKAGSNAHDAYHINIHQSYQ